MWSASSRYPNLFSPLAIGNVTVRNRLLQTGHGKLYSDGQIDSRRTFDYQVERAKGGIGLIVTGNRLIHPTSAIPRLSNGWLRDGVAVDRRMVKAVREQGATIFAQINHFGMNAPVTHPEDYRPLWAPSAFRSPSTGEIPKEVEPDDIREAIDWWALTAELSREAGFDGVEVHLSHTYLLHEFLSPLYNKRTDEYGGAFENRLRLACEVIDEVRRRVGSDYVVGVRMSLTDFFEGGLDIDDAVRVATTLEATGQIDFLDTTAAGSHVFHMIIPPADVPDGWLVDLAAQVKAAVATIPVFVVGGLKDPKQAEEIIRSGKGDMVAMTRAQIADPEFASKARDGREDEIYHCIRANQGCIGNTVFRGYPMLCTVNPATGREGRFGSGKLVPADPPRSWLVVGAGPAGMKAAETLAKRGHEVTLVEKERQLGGQVNLILKTPGRESFAWITRDLETHMRKHRVDIRLGVEATAEFVRAFGADGVVVATGSVPSRTGFSNAALLTDRLPGVEQENVVSVWDVLLETRPIGQRVVVLDDEGGRAAAGTAEVLLDRGREVTIVTPLNALFASTMSTLDMPILYRRLLTKKLSAIVNSWVEEIRGDVVRVINLYTEEESRLDADTVVLATAPTAHHSLYLELKGEIENLHRIGDCLAPRKLDHAIFEGFVAGCELWSTAERYSVFGSLEVWQEQRPELLVP